jgi:penicillin-binding protein 2
MDFAGKTGSAQVVRLSGEHPAKCENMKFAERDNALFVGFAPVKDPVIAVAVVAEHACHGASGAAPIAKEVIKTYLQKYFPNLYGEKALAARIKGEKLSKKALPQEEDEDVRNENEHLPLLEEHEQQAPPPLPPGAASGDQVPR